MNNQPKKDVKLIYYLLRIDLLRIGNLCVSLVILNSEKCEVLWYAIKTASNAL